MDTKLKWIIIFGFFGTLLISIMLDFHFRFVVSFGIIFILWHFRSSVNKLLKLKSDNEVIGHEEIVMQQYKENLVDTVDQLSAIHQRTAESEAEVNLSLIRQQIAAQRHRTEQQYQLQDLRHRKELELLAEKELAANLQNDKSCMEILERTRKVTEAERAAAKLKYEQKSAELDAQLERNREMENARVKDAIRKSNVELEIARNRYKI